MTSLAGWRTTPAPAEHVQIYSVHNYHRFVDGSSAGKAASSSGGRALHGAVAAGNVSPAEHPRQEAGGLATWAAYHLIAEGRSGIALVNIGVGLSARIATTGGLQAG